MPPLTLLLLQWTSSTNWYVLVLLFRILAETGDTIQRKAVVLSILLLWCSISDYAWPTDSCVCCAVQVQSLSVRVSAGCGSSECATGACLTSKLVETFQSTAQYTRRQYQTKQAQHVLPALCLIVGLAGIVSWVASFVCPCMAGWTRQLFRIAFISLLLGNISIFKNVIVMVCSSSQACNGEALFAKLHQAIEALSVFLLDVYSFLQAFWTTVVVASRVAVIAFIERLIASPAGKPVPVPVSTVVDCLFWFLCACVILLLKRRCRRDKK